MNEGQVLLDTETSDQVQAAGRALVARVRELLADIGPADDDSRVAFVASIVTQAAVRGLANAAGSLPDSAITGAGEGIGMILGHVPDPEPRIALFQSVVQAMAMGTQASGRIHEPAGSA